MTELAPHQRDAVTRILALLDRYGGAILADDVGLGKSFVAAAVAAEMQARACAVEVIVPASLVPQWRDTLSDFGVDARRWTLLTGPLEAIERAAIAGFKLGLSREPPAPGEPPGDGVGGIAILHGTRLVLVDGDAAIRGYYEADGEGMARLERDLAALIDAGGR